MTRISRDRTGFPRRSGGTFAALLLLTVLLGAVSLCPVGPRRSAAQAAEPSEPGNSQTPPRTIVEQTIRPLVDDGTHVGIVVGIVDRGRRREFAYGRSGSESTPRLDGDSLFEIGSVTKTFTALLLAEMIERGDVTVTDPIRMYLPATVTVPQYGETPITLLDLATHTSGLPRLPDNLDPSNQDNPYADYTVAKLYRFLSHYKPTRASGAQYDYSNLGVGLLGYLLSLRAGQNYEDLVVSRLCDPLGLKSTRFRLSAELHSRLVPGHDASGHPVPNWEFTPALAGAGALRSSAHDMLQYVTANLDLSAPRLKAAMSNTHSARHRVDAGQAILYVALGWHVLNVNGAEIIWHNGGTGGYSSIVCFNRKRRVGLVALSNSAEPGDKQPLTDAGLLALTKIISPSDQPSTRPGHDGPVPVPVPGVNGPTRDAPTPR